MRLMPEIHSGGRLLFPPDVRRQVQEVTPTSTEVLDSDPVPEGI